MVLRVRSDSTTALQLLLTLRCSGKGPNIIGKELTLDVAKGAYRQDVAVHLPGVANAGPDVLSRLSMPESSGEIPAYLHAVKRECPPRRDDSYFFTVINPALTSVASHRGTWDGRIVVLRS